MSTIQGLNRNQLFLAPCLEDTIEQDNFVRIIDALVDSWDLEKLGFANAVPSHMGRPSYAADDLLKLYIYGYYNGIRTSRKLEDELYRNVELMWLLKSLRPDHKTIAEFRRKNPKPMEKSFRAFTLMLDEWGLLGREIIAVDGTKIRAYNNKKRNFTRKGLARRLKGIDEKISSYMSELERNDHEEEAIPSVDVEAAIKSLKERKEKYEGYEQELKESGENEISLTDPDSRLMGNNRGGVDVCYNVQSAVDAKHHLIVEMNVTNNPTDHGQLGVMCKRIRKRLKIRRFMVLADKGYYNAEDLKRCKKYKITAIVARQKSSKDAPDTAYNTENFVYDKSSDSFTCPAGEVLERTGTKASKQYANKKACSTCVHRESCTTGTHRRVSISHDQGIYDETDKRLSENKELYKKRQMIVEHPFGTIKHFMNGGYFVLRGMRMVRGEVALLFLGYNLKRAINILGFEGMMRRIRAYSLRFFLFIPKTRVSTA